MRASELRWRKIKSKTHRNVPHPAIDIFWDEVVKLNILLICLVGHLFSLVHANRYLIRVNKDYYFWCEGYAWGIQNNCCKMYATAAKSPCMTKRLCVKPLQLRFVSHAVCIYTSISLYNPNPSVTYTSKTTNKRQQQWYHWYHGSIILWEEYSRYEWYSYIWTQGDLSALNK